jgi:hypothetical protein
MRAIVTDEQRRSRTEAGLPKGRVLLGCAIAKFRLHTPGMRAKFGFGSPQNRPAKCQDMLDALH